VHRLPLLMLFALAVAACGNSKATKTTSTSSPTTTPPTVQAFVAAGNKVCQDTDKQIMSIGRLTRDPRGWARTYEAAKAGVLAMQKVTPPPNRARAFKLMLRYANALALSMQEVHNALAKKNIDIAAAAQLAAGRIQDKVHEQAKAVGLTFCQQPLTNWPA
jgi:hypothetical protein